jgi:hypothetical protein
MKESDRGQMAVVLFLLMMMASWLLYRFDPALGYALGAIVLLVGSVFVFRSFTRQ